MFFPRFAFSSPFSPKKTSRKAKEESLKQNDKQLAGKLRLEERIAPFKLKINEDTDAEGACQFDSAADQLRVMKPGCETITKEQVRAMTIAWLRDNPSYRLSDDPANDDTLSSWVRDTQGISWEQYLAGMAVANAWGDEITLKGIVETFRVRIMLLSSTVDPDNYYSLHRPKGDSDSCPTLWMCHFLEVHYGSLLQLLEYDRRDQAKKKRFVELMRPLPYDRQLLALCDVVLLDNARLCESLEKASISDHFKQCGGDMAVTMEVMEAIAGKPLNVPLRRIAVYGSPEASLSVLDAKLQAELGRALSIIKALKEENAALRHESETRPQVGQSLSWSALVDEDGKKWLRAAYSLPEAQAGDMLSLQRLALHGATAKVVQRVPLPSSIQGSLLFEFPVTIGHYELVYSRKGEVRVKSDMFLNRPHVQLAFVSLDNRHMDIEWTMTDASLAQASDWIAVYKVDEPLLQNYINFCFVRPSSSVVSIPIPSDPKGTTKFVVRYFCGDNKWYPVAELQVNTA